MESDSQRMKRQFCCASGEDFVSDKPVTVTAISPPKSTGLADPAALQKEALSLHHLLVTYFQWLLKLVPSLTFWCCSNVLKGWWCRERVFVWPGKQGLCEDSTEVWARSQSIILLFVDRHGRNY